jgi:FkbH-like protein
MLADSTHILTKIRSTPPGQLRLSEYQTLAREVSAAGSGVPRTRVVLLASYTTTVLDAFVRVEAARHGLFLDVHHGAFGQFEQELMGATWRGADGGAEVLVLAMRLEDLDPTLPHRFHSSLGAFDAFAAGVLDRVETLIGLFRERSNGAVLVANFAPPEPRPLGVFDANHPQSLTWRVQDLNKALCARLRTHPGCHVWDYAGLVGAMGSSSWADPRLWALGRIPIAARHQPYFGAHLARTIRGVLRPPAKCLVVDLDGVLWGGVVGDDGVSGIVLGDDHPGLAFKEFQRAILGLRDRGILLAICSKNDEEVAREAITRHPEMLVSLDDFAAARINWTPKSHNLREIAAELSIGIDSLVLFDDSPFERGEVTVAEPAVHVVAVPTDPVDYVRALADVALFDVPGLTEEDHARAASYRAERERRSAEGGSASLEDFLTSLEMEATIGSLGPLTSQRIAQLVAKTNQFNLTTRRQSQTELEAAAAATDQAVYWLRLGDRHGDMGLIAVGVVRFRGNDAFIDNLVLSCRAANRGVEQTLLAHVASVARERGCTGLVGQYIPTARNHVVANLYPGLGFMVEPGGGQGTRFRFDLARRRLSPPDYLRVRLVDESATDTATPPGS